MIKRLLLMSFVLLLLDAGSAIAQDVRYNFDKDAEFAKFKTYKWVTLKDAVRLDDINDKNIKAALDAEFVKKGLTMVDSDNADLYVGYQAAVNQEKEYTSYSSDWGYGSGWYRGGWYGMGGSSMTTGQTSTIYIGQLAIDIYDSINHNLVWRGVASKTLDTTAKPDKQKKNLNKAVTKLLKNFPPGTKS